MKLIPIKNYYEHINPNANDVMVALAYKYAHQLGYQLVHESIQNSADDDFWAHKAMAAKGETANLHKVIFVSNKAWFDKVEPKPDNKYLHRIEIDFFWLSPRIGINFGGLNEDVTGPSIHLTYRDDIQSDTQVFGDIEAMEKDVEVSKEIRDHIGVRCLIADADNSVRFVPVSTIKSFLENILTKFSENGIYDIRVQDNNDESAGIPEDIIGYLDSYSCVNVLDANTQIVIGQISWDSIYNGLTSFYEKKIEPNLCEKMLAGSLDKAETKQLLFTLINNK